MKKVLLTIAMMVASSAALAMPVATDSWQKIRQTPGVMVTQGYSASVFGPEGYFNACVKGNEFHSIKPVVNCVKWAWDNNVGGQEGPGPSAQKCLQYATTHVSLPRVQTSQVCVQWSPFSSGGGQEDGGSYKECLKYETKTALLPTTMTFSAFNWYANTGGGQEGGMNDNSFLFHKSYTVPACK